MKKNRSFRPRRGIRFTNGRRGVSPVAGFIGGSSIARTRPFEGEGNLNGLPPNYFAGSRAHGNTADIGLDELNIQVLYSSIGTVGNGYLVSFIGDAPSATSVSLVESPVSSTLHYNSGSLLGLIYDVFASSSFLNPIGSGNRSVTCAISGSGTISLSGGSDAIPSSVPDETRFRVASARSLGSDSIVVSGSVMVSARELDGNSVAVSQVVSSSSIRLQGAISTGRRYERQKLNALLISAPTNNLGGLLPGVPPSPSQIIDAGVIPGVPSGSSVAGVPVRIDPPSWTRAYMGTNQAFVIGNFQSGTGTLNTYSSGSDTLESSPIIVTRANRYAKEQRFQTITVKKTASFFDTIVPQADGAPLSGVFVPSSFTSGLGALINTVTGTNGPSKAIPASPATIMIPVPVSGRLVDIKVWLEVVHASASATVFPLGSLGVSLRNPNVTWGVAHPMVNDPNLFESIKGQQFREANGVIQDFYRDTFILWEGGNVFVPATIIDTGPAGGTLNNGGQSVFDPAGVPLTMYPTWQADRGIRTVFSDSATVQNPRSLYSSNLSGNYIGSPNSAPGIAANSSRGCNVPWTSDISVGAGTYTGTGSPPAGWLTGQGGTSDVNEWPTTGVNYGTPQIQPLYPLLDPILSRKSIGTEGVVGSLVQPFDPAATRGFRPGLRGTEISGTWQLLLTNNYAFASYSTTASMPTYFRQVRLEITYETPPWSRLSGHSPIARYGASRAGRRDIFRVSGSSSPANALRADYWVNTISVDTPSQTEFGRTFGLVPNSGTVRRDSAMFYRLSGALATALGNQTPSWLFSGPNGMPVLPESSASLVPIHVQPLSSSNFTAFTQPRATLNLPQRLSDIANDANPQLSLRDLAAAFVSSSAI